MWKLQKNVWNCEIGAIQRSHLHMMPYTYRLSKKKILLHTALWCNQHFIPWQKAVNQLKARAFCSTLIIHPHKYNKCRRISKCKCEWPHFALAWIFLIALQIVKLLKSRIKAPGWRLSCRQCPETFRAISVWIQNILRRFSEQSIHNRHSQLKNCCFSSNCQLLINP